MVLTSLVVECVLCGMLCNSLMVHFAIRIVTWHFNQGPNEESGVTKQHLDSILGTAAKLVADSVTVMGSAASVLRDLKRSR